MQNPAEEAIMLLVHMRLQNADGIWLVLFAYFGRNTNRVACNFIGQKRKETEWRLITVTLILQTDFLMLCPHHASQKFPSEKVRKPAVKKCSSAEV